MGVVRKMRGGMQHSVRVGCGCVALCLLHTGAAEAGTRAKVGRRPVVLSAWEQAVLGREELESSAAGEKKKAQFTRVLEGFRAIYHADPGAQHAADAVNAVAEVLQEQGCEFGDAESFLAAVGQYEFLRKQYPTSSLRVPALLAEARIEELDLHDRSEARERYGAVVSEYPRHGAAAEARSALLRLGRGEAGRGVGRVGEGDGIGGAASGAATRAKGAQRGARFESMPRVDGKEAVTPGRAEEELAPAVMEATRSTDRRASARAAGGQAAGSQAAGNRATGIRVTGIRHWSTPTYTRVAIDLGDEVKFEAARVPHPDRIYFDLHGTKLDQELVGKSFDVRDDGFLKRIRAAQDGSDVTRVVLDVNDVADYTAFLLPNPYRLIIDIHGAAAARSTAHGAGEKLAEALDEAPVTAGAGQRASAAANASGLPAMAVTDGGGSGTVAQPGTRRAGPSQGGSGRTTDAHLSRDETASKMGHPSSRAGSRAGVGASAEATTTEVAAVSDLPGKVEATSAPSSKPIVAVASGREGNGRTKDRRRTGNGGDEALLKAGPNAEPARAAERTADGETSLIRALGLKIGRIVIDAGHGGHDSGTLGVDGLQEKDVVLDVALRLGRLLHERLGAEIIYTRSDDTFIPLETRTAIANKAQADLFLSVHANSSSDDSARGVETYYLNFTSSPDALETAARENAVSGQSIHQLSDLVKKITLKDKIAESREFAQDVESSLYAGLQRGNEGLKNRGVKKAPFVVLIGANMPSILAEISFVTNARDAGQLRRPEYRERVAESLFAGVAKYESGLAGTRQSGATTRASTE